jgi:chemotaxis protein CheC
LEQVSELLGGAEELVIGIYMRVFGECPSKIIFLFKYQDALTLVEKLTGVNVTETGTIGEFEESALKEISNIMTGAYLYALIQLTGFTIIPSVPAFACDMAGAILNSALLDCATIGDHALLVETQFSVTDQMIDGHFFMVPDPGALESMLNALGVGPSCKK